MVMIPCLCWLFLAYNRPEFLDRILTIVACVAGGYGWARRENQEQWWTVCLTPRAVRGRRPSIGETEKGDILYFPKDDEWPPLCRRRGLAINGLSIHPQRESNPCLSGATYAPSNSPPSGNGNADAEAAAPVVQKTQFVVDGQGPYKRWF